MSRRLEDSFQREVQRRQQKQKKPDGGKFRTTLLIVVLAIMAGYVIHQVRAGSKVSSVVDPPDKQTELSKPAKPKPPAPKPVALPPSGVRKQGLKPGEPASKLRIFVRAPLSSENSKVASGCGGDVLDPVKNVNNYYVELLDWQSGKIVTTAFVRFNETLEIPVPYGSYKLRYAEGLEWYGDKNMFGSQDMYEMTEKFSETATQLDFDETRGHDIGFHCSNGNSGRKRVTKSPQEALPTTTKEISI